MPDDVTEPRIDAEPEIGTQNRTLIFVAALASVFVTAIEATIVATAMPTIVSSLGDFQLISWVFTAYLLTQAVMTPIYGRLADLYGRRPILLIGSILFLLGSILCGFAWSMFSLVLFRALQGLGAGALMSVGRTLIGDIYHGADRAKMQGYVSGTFIGAATLGPMVGAFLATHTIWAMVFWVNIPIAGFAGAVLYWGFNERIAKKRHRIDWGGCVLICVGTGTLMFALAESGAIGWSWAVVLIVISLIVLAGFVLYERWVHEPIWPTSLWSDRIASSGNIVSLVMGATSMGIAAYLPLYIQGVIGDTALVSGMAIMAMSAAGPMGAFFAGRAMLRTSFRGAAFTGAVIYIVGSVLMTMLDPQSSATWAMASALLMGFGVGMNNNTYLVAVQAETAWNQRGIATSTLVFSRILGQAIGASAFGGILTARLMQVLNGRDDLVAKIMSNGLRGSVPAEQLVPIITAFDQALHLIFYILVASAVVVAVIGFMLPRGRGLRSPKKN